MKSLLATPLEPSDLLSDGAGESGFKIRAARSWGERSAASLLINRLYGLRGYRSNPLPGSQEEHCITLVATESDKVVGTLTVGFDSDELLLADDLFPDELNALRARGFQLCEFTKLAVDALVRSQRVLAAMFHVAFIHAHHIRGCDRLLIEVNPRHRRFYEAKLGFEQFGPMRMNRRVGAPAVLLALDLWQARARISEFGGRPDANRLERSLYPFAFSAQEETGIIARLCAPRRGDLMAAGCAA
jgi:hypothetical protein